MNYNSSSLALKYKQQPRRKQRVRTVYQPVTRSRLVCFLIAAFIILVAITGMTFMKSQVYSNKVEIAELNSQLNKIKVENDSNELAMKSNINLQYVYDVATGKLGMKKLTNDHIIRYDTENTDYIKQVGDLTK